MRILVPVFCFTMCVAIVLLFLYPEKFIRVIGMYSRLLFK